jgi:hypothetical protein
MKPNKTPYASKYAALKELMPVLESASFEDSQSLIEPFPAKAKAWVLLGQKATLVGVIIAVLLALLTLTVTARYITLDHQVHQTPFPNAASIQRAYQFQQKFTASDLPRNLSHGQIANVIAPLLHSCPAWTVKVDNNLLSIDYTLDSAISSEDITTSIDKAMSQLGYTIQSQDKEVQPLRHLVTYVSQ